VTLHTWSRYVSITISGLAGRRDIARRSGNILVVMPLHRLRWSLWFRFIQAKHWFGFHHFAEEYECDLETGSVQYSGYRCLFCDAE
jgi:hypothetical protein